MRVTPRIHPPGLVRPLWSGRAGWFEEAGVLLAGPEESTVDPAGPARPDPRVVVDVGDGWEADRLAVETRQLGFAELLRRRGLLLRSDLLVPWARWVTPPFEPRRFDTYFFLARMPDGQLTRDIGGEAEHTRWVRPAELADGSNAMLPPTAVTLWELAHYSTVDEALTAAATRDLVADRTTRAADQPKRPVM
jgi:hypothetical protein